ncbi:hypothetical protein LPUS_11471 [Lasallia pustulata]|uniref:Uncharacterized protein n=1 Tax=Lasallia pustulata TaxID=136370 RepID=A0A1W5DC81_9LECA|nr:hypothetical protein LPUS_11471 [Lasallia pustulata]
MDDLTAILVAKLQLEDIDELTDRSKNKQGCLTDADHALIAYKEELQELETFISDRRLGRSISEAVQSDGEYITAARVEEENALRDRHLACALGGVRDSQKDAADKLAYVDVDEELLRRLSLLNDSQNPFSLSEESHIAVVSAARNSAMYAGNDGRHATVCCGTKSAFMLEEPRLFNATISPVMLKSNNDGWNTLYRIYANDMSANTNAGYMYADRTYAKSVITHFLSTYLNADNAAFRPATAVDGTGYQSDHAHWLDDYIVSAVSNGSRECAYRIL